MILKHTEYARLLDALAKMHVNVTGIMNVATADPKFVVYQLGLLRQQLTMMHAVVRVMRDRDEANWAKPDAPELLRDIESFHAAIAAIDRAKQ